MELVQRRPERPDRPGALRPRQRRPARRCVHPGAEGGHEARVPHQRGDGLDEAPNRPVRRIAFRRRRHRTPGAGRVRRGGIDLLESPILRTRLLCCCCGSLEEEDDDDDDDSSCKRTGARAGNRPATSPSSRGRAGPERRLLHYSWCRAGGVCRGASGRRASGAPAGRLVSTSSAVLVVPLRRTWWIWRGLDGCLQDLHATRLGGPVGTDGQSAPDSPSLARRGRDGASFAVLLVRCRHPAAPRASGCNMVRHGTRPVMSYQVQYWYRSYRTNSIEALQPLTG